MPKPFLYILALILPFPGQSIAQTQFVIQISVDGLHPDALTVRGSDRAPNFHRLVTEGAYTGDARTDVNFTNTLPNHAGMMTGRRVIGADGHGVTFNDLHPGTFESVHGSYVAGVFDVAHDHGLRTALFYSKDKFHFYARSWDGAHGAPDTVGIDNGRAKIDRAVFLDDTESLTAEWLADMRQNPYNYSFIHWRDPDTIGHAREWMSGQYLDAVVKVDGHLGQLFGLIESDTTFAGKTTIILTSDHGGIGTDHNSATTPDNFMVPVIVWGPGVDAGSDLYQLNWDSRLSACEAQVAHGLVPPPIRNTGTGNLALSALGLPAIPASTVNHLQDLRLSLPAGVELPSVRIDSPVEGQRFVTGDPISLAATPTAGTDAIERVDFVFACDTVGSATTEPFTSQLPHASPGDHQLAVSAFDVEGRFTTSSVTISIDAGLNINGSDSDWMALGVDPVVDTDSLQSDPEVALDRLFFREDSSSVYFGFDAAAISRDVVYGLYIDLDATNDPTASDPLGYAIETSSRHAPELAFYFVHDAGDGWSDASPVLFRFQRQDTQWIDAGWPGDFDFSANSETGFLEFAFPGSVITDYPGAQGIFAQLFTVGSTPGAGASESVPSDPAVPFTEENTSPDPTRLSAFHDFSFPEFDGETIVVDGHRFDWGRAGIRPFENASDVQREPELAASGLSVTHDLENLYFAVHAEAGPRPVTFGLYMDAGNFTGSGLGAGSSISAVGLAVETTSPFQPDVQVYFENDTAGVWSPDARYFYWNEADADWSRPVSENDSGLPGGGKFASAQLQGTWWVEFSIPRDAPGLNESDSLWIELFTVGGTPGAGASFTIPEDPGVRFEGENTSTDVTILSAPLLYSTRPTVVRAALDHPDPATEKGGLLLSPFPNPAVASVNVGIRLTEHATVSLTVHDLLGREVSVVMNRALTPGDHAMSLDVSQLSGGIYFLRLDVGGSISTKKLIVAR